MNLNCNQLNQQFESPLTAITAATAQHFPRTLALELWALDELVPERCVGPPGEALAAALGDGKVHQWAVRRRRDRGLLRVPHLKQQGQCR